MLAPCFWTSRIQAGDLGSHLYNAWLAQLARSGSLHGIFVGRLSTNVLFDWMLVALRPLGPAAMERIAVAISVLIFIWGAFAFISGFSRRRPWHMLPLLGVLAYGWVFQMGFLNYYLAVGLSLWALALCRDPRRPIPLLAAGALLLTAWLGNPIPVLWALAAGSYRALLPRLPWRWRFCLPGAALLLLAACGFQLRSAFPARWTAGQVWWVSGADQLWVYGSKYLGLAAALLLVWSAWAWLAVAGRGWRELSANLPFHFILLAGFAAFILPNVVLFPGYGHAIAYIPERLSLITAISICALLSQIRPPWVLRAAAYIPAAMYFVFLFLDASAFDRVESAMSRAVEGLPRMARVVSPLAAPDWRVNPYTHMIDRVCIGRCYSYANYEPCTAVFRVRCASRNGVVVDNYEDSFAMQSGNYMVTATDPQLTEIFPCDGVPGDFCLRILTPGDRLTPRAAPPWFFVGQKK
jgi:hypothetical protein